MKKFLSLVLALIMTMSLVTISAGATEYKDLTDKDEIQYEEAVAVLNRIGVITGYDDGSFQPTKELTRGAAAKIIVSLLIGPEAASNLPNNYAPYPDVPAGHTFAGVISYCKTANIISGYGDGTFKPGNTLTGYAFAKMLLGAVGYDSKLEKFVDTGWTMNVASVGQSAGLFDRLKFDGSKAVNREEACQLALNALKATVVQYSQGINVNVTGENTNVVVSGGQTRSYKTSNQEFARNIRVRGITGSLVNQVDDDYYTVEFAEEHFVDLRLEHDKYNPTRDEFGRPSAEWSYKKVTIGTYALEPDFEFTTQIAHKEATTASRERATKLGNYDLESNTSRTTEYTNLWLNGERVQRGESSRYAGVNGLEKIYEIADLTDNGNLVQVYVSESDADFITDVVVIQTQLMEVKRVNSEYVSLDRVSPASKDNAAYGYNLPAIHEEVTNVREDDEAFAVLSTLKSGDKVAVIPVADDLDGSSFSVSRVYVPETVSGELQKATSYANVGTDRNAVDVTVGGTTYKVANWSKDLVGIDANKIKITRKDVSLLLDEYGNALLGKDVGEDSEYMIVGSWGSTLMNGRIVNLVEGWTVGGEAVSLNVGTRKYPDIVPGDLVKYTSDGATGAAEWVLVDGASAKIYNVDRVKGTNAYAAATTTPDYEVKSSNVRVALENIEAGNADADRKIASDCKFIYVDFDENTGDVETIEFVKTRQNISAEELDKYNTSYDKFDWNNAQNNPANTAEAYLKDDFVKAIVVKTESNNSNGQLAYVANYTGYHQKVNDGGLVKAIWGYEVIMPNADGELEMLELYTTKDYQVGTFIRYTKAEAPAEVTEDKVKENFYTTSTYSSTEKATSVALLQGVNVLRSGYGDDKYSKDLVRFTYGFKTGERNLKNVLAGNGSYRDALVSDEVSVGDTVYDVLNGGNFYTADVSTLAATGRAAVVSGYRGLGDNDDQNPRTLRVDADSDAWYDLRDTNYRDTITSVEDLTDYVPESIALAIVFNDKRDSDNFRSVSRVIVLRAIPKGDVAPTPGAVTVTANAADGVLGAGNVILDPAGTISFTATTSGATGKGVEYKFVWKVDGTVVRTQYTSGLTDTWAGNTGANLQGKKVTCEVTCTTDDKPISSEIASASINFAAPAAPDSVSVGTEDTLLNGVPATFKATVKDAKGEEITGAALSTLTFKWGQVVENEEGEKVFKPFTDKQIADLGITVNEDGTMTVADPAKIAGMTISCEVSADGEKVEAPTEGEDVEAVDPTLPDDPDATTYTVTFDIAEGAKVTVGTKSLTSASKDKSVAVDAGSELSFTIGVAAGGQGIPDVASDHGYNMVESDGTYSFVVTKSGTVKVTMDIPDATKLNGLIGPANLHDNSESGEIWIDATGKKVEAEGDSVPEGATEINYVAVPDDALMNYTVDVTSEGGKTTFKVVSEEGLYPHFSNMTPQQLAYWMGFYVKAAGWDLDGWTLTKYINSKGNEVTLSFDGVGSESGQHLYLGRAYQNGKTEMDFQLVFEKSGATYNMPITWDMSGVTFNELYVAPAPAPEA